MKHHDGSEIQLLILSIEFLANLPLYLTKIFRSIGALHASQSSWGTARWVSPALGHLEVARLRAPGPDNSNPGR